MYNILLKYGYPNGWPDKIQHENFFNLLSSLKFRKKEINELSFLDAGCGTGDLFYVLKSLGCKDYTGIDIFEPSLIIARTTYPDGNFINKSVLDNTNYYDYILASGLISNTTEYFTYLILNTLWEHCRNVFAFNFISEPTKLLSWYEVDDLVEYCEKFSTNISVISYENQTTIIIQK